MSCNYTIKHYWDEKTKSATLEPKWISSGEKLSSEQESIKKLYEKTLGDATYYSKLAESKVEFETINGYKIKYSYLEKDDPLHKNARRVTDISMCIKTPMKLPIKSFLISTFFVFITFLVGYYLLNQTTEEPKNKKIELHHDKVQVDAVIRKNNLVVKDKKEEKFYICNEEWKTYIIEDNKGKKDTYQTSCLQSYFTSYCNKKTELISKEWLKQTKDINCIGIEVFQYDSLKSDTFKRSRKLKKQVKKFLQGKI